MNLGWVGQTLVLPLVKGLPFAVRGGLPDPWGKGKEASTLLSSFSYFTMTFHYPNEVSSSYRHRKYKSRTAIMAFKRTIQHYFHSESASIPLARH